MQLDRTAALGAAHAVAPKCSSPRSQRARPRAEYTLVGDDTIVVATPTKNTIVARATGKVEGMGKYSKSRKVYHEFDGTFVRECTDKTLNVWRAKKNGEALDLEREAP